MANRQYIGARYVPVYRGTWTITAEYEPLTIVSANGSSYTSKKQVPAGIDINNAEYWAVSSIMNEETHNALVKAEEANASVEAVRGIAERAEASAIGAITTAEQASIKQNLKGLKAIAIGDSYCRGVGSSDNRGWAHYLKDISGMDVDIYGNSQAGFTRAGVTAPFNGMNFNNMLNSILTNYSTEAKKEISYIICAGGYNDHIDFDGNKLGGAVHTFIDMCKNNFPNAKVVIIPLSSNDVFTANKFNAYSTINTNAGNRGAVSLLNSIYWLYGIPSYSSGDNIHPNNDGYKFQGGMIASVINGGSGERSFGWGNISFTNGTTVASNFRVSCTNGVCNWQGGITVSGSPGNDTPILTMNERIRPGTTQYIPAWYFKGNTLRQMGCVRVRADGDVTIAPSQTAPSLSGISDYSIYICASYMVGM